MSVLRINGGNRLSGSVRVHGAKNSVLPIIAATILANGETVIHNCPNLSDVDAAVNILRHLGCTAERTGEDIFVDSSHLTRCDIPDAMMREMRSSVIFLGVILARAGEAVLSLPGGCELGPRPIDMHLDALKAMGAEIREDGGNIICRAHHLKGCRIDLRMPSVGATENSMLAASRCSGVTVITNAAREPEIVDLQEYLKKIGIRVEGAGTPVITVEGTREARFAEHAVIPDRIVAATYLSAAASTGGRIVLDGVVPGHLSTVTDVLAGMGCRIKIGKDNIMIDAGGGLRSVKPVITEPYPGFPTDAQPPVMAAALKAAGTTAFVENIFENRFRHVPELLRMGADIRTEGKVAIVSGVKELRGAPVSATDLRGGAALIVAALGAEGTSEINDMMHVDRGYDDIVGALTRLGADVGRHEAYREEIKWPGMTGIIREKSAAG